MASACKQGLASASSTALPTLGNAVDIGLIFSEFTAASRLRAPSADLGGKLGLGLAGLLIPLGNTGVGFSCMALGGDTPAP